MLTTDDVGQTCTDEWPRDLSDAPMIVSVKPLVRECLL